MNRARLAVILAGLAVAAAAATLLFLVKGGGARASAAAGSWSSCGDGPAVAVVYGEGQDAFAETLRGLLERQLRDAMPNGTRFCSVSLAAAGLGETPRVLPLIAVRGEPRDPQLASLLLNETIGPGFRPLMYDVVAMYDLQVGLATGAGQPRYSTEARLVVVQGHYSFTKANVSRLAGDERALAILSALYAANITGVDSLEPDKAPSVLLEAANGSLPAFFAESSGDLAEGTFRVTSLGQGYYRLRESTTRVLARMGLVDAWEEKIEPPPVERHPSIGSGPVHVAVFEDFLCPFCARFYNTSFPVLEEAAARGEATIHFLDLVVHREVLRLHELMYCLYNATGDSRQYLDRVKEIYRAMLESNTTQQLMDKLKKIEEELNSSVGLCPGAEQAVAETTHWALNHGLQGTPSFAAWREGSDTVVLATGYRGPEFFKQLLGEMTGGS